MSGEPRFHRCRDAKRLMHALACRNQQYAGARQTPSSPAASLIPVPSRAMDDLRRELTDSAASSRSRATCNVTHDDWRRREHFSAVCVVPSATRWAHRWSFAASAEFVTSVAREARPAEVARRRVLAAAGRRLLATHPGCRSSEAPRYSVPRTWRASLISTSAAAAVTPRPILLVT